MNEFRTKGQQERARQTEKEVKKYVGAGWNWWGKVSGEVKEYLQE